MQLPEGFVLDTPKKGPVYGAPAKVDPYKERDQQLQEEAAQRAREDQDLQMRKFGLDQQKAALDMEKTQRSLEPGADTSESEKTAGFLATRVAGGIKELDRITAKDPTAKSPTFGVEAVRSIFGDTAANYFTDADRQQVVAAQTDILDAALTLGTGAAYTEEQLKGYRQSYFPQLGDDNATVAAKQKRLVQLLESAKVKAGRSSPMIDQALAAVSGGNEQPDLGISVDPAMLNEQGQPKGYGPEDYAQNGYVSDELRSKNDALNSAWMSGEIRNVDELFAKAASLGLDISKTDRKSLALQIKTGKRGSFAPNPDQNGPPENNPPTGGGNAPSEPRGLGDAFMSGVGDVVEGAGDLVGLVGNPLNAGINAIAGTNLSTDLGQTFRDATGIPRGNPYAEAINKGGIGALIPAGAANALARGGSSLAKSAVTNALAQQPIQQGVGGATAGLASEAVNQAGGGPVMQTLAALGGGVGGFAGANALAQRGAQATTGAMQASPRLIPNAGQVVQEGERAGVRVMTSDIRPPATRLGKLVRNMGDSIPIAGTAGPRAKQQVERGDAVRKLMEDFGADEAAVDAVSADLVKTRGAVIGKLTDAKKSVIEGIKGAVPAPKAIAEIDKQIAKLKGIDDTAFKPVVDRLEGFKKALQSGKSLEQVEGQRRLLSGLFEDASLASIKDDGQKAINAVYNPLKEDMGAFIEASAGPAAKAKWAGANERLSAMAGELDASAFKNLLNKAETTPESAANIIFGKTPSDMRRLYGSLSDKGRAKAQSAILFKAAEKSTTNDIISPQKFATAMEAMSKATGVFFSPADKARIDGMARLIKSTQHASDAAANPMTGAQNTPILAGFSIGQIFGTAALPATAAAGLLARVYESKPVRDAFLRLGRTKRGSPQEKRAAQGVISSIAAANDNGGNFLANMPNSPTSAAASERDQVEN